MRNLLHEVLHEVFEKVFSYVYNQSSNEKQNAPSHSSTSLYIVLKLPIILKFLSEIIISPEDVPAFKIDEITTK